MTSKDKPKPKTGDPEWLKEYFHFEWQTIRRHPGYVKFCEEYQEAFDDGLFDPLKVDSEIRLKVAAEAEMLKQRFGLSVIRHHTVDISEENILKWDVFENELAVYHEAREKNPFDYDPPWDKRFIKLTIDVTKTKKQIRKDVWWEVEWARRHLGITGTKFKPNYDMFKVWDLYKQGKTRTDIIRGVWPDEYKQECGDDSSKTEEERDRLFSDLQQKYNKQGVKDWEEKAYQEAYGERDEDMRPVEGSESGKIRFFMRVRDSLRRMERLFGRFNSG
jgi:hypothetical protein